MKERPPLGYDPDFAPICLHEEDEFVVQFYFHDLVTGMKKNYDDFFTLNIVGAGKTWEEIEYWDDEVIYESNPFCNATEEQKKKYHPEKRIFYVPAQSTP